MWSNPAQQDKASIEDIKRRSFSYSEMERIVREVVCLSYSGAAKAMLKSGECGLIEGAKMLLAAAMLRTPGVSKDPIPPSLESVVRDLIYGEKEDDDEEAKAEA